MGTQELAKLDAALGIVFIGIGFFTEQGDGVIVAVGGAVGADEEIARPWVVGILAADCLKGGDGICDFSIVHLDHRPHSARLGEIRGNGENPVQGDGRLGQFFVGDQTFGQCQVDLRATRQGVGDFFKKLHGFGRLLGPDQDFGLHQGGGHVDRVLREHFGKEIRRRFVLLFRVGDLAEHGPSGQEIWGGGGEFIEVGHCVIAALRGHQRTGISD